MTGAIELYFPFPQTSKIEQKRYEEAIKVYEQAIALEPLNPNPLVNLAWVKQTLGTSSGSSRMVRDAEQLYEQSLRIKPTSEAFMRLGEQRGRHFFIVVDVRS